MDQRRGEGGSAEQARGEARVEGLGSLVGGEEQPGGREGGDDDAANALVEPAEDIAGVLAGRRGAREGLEIVLALEASLDCVQGIDDEVDGEGGRSACLQTRPRSARSRPARCRGYSQAGFPCLCCSSHLTCAGPWRQRRTLAGLGVLVYLLSQARRTGPDACHGCRAGRNRPSGVFGDDDISQQ